MKKILSAVTAVFLVAMLLLLLLSWLLSVTMVPGVRSLLTGEALRYVFSNLVSGLASPLLVWIIMAAIAAGCLVHCYRSHRSKGLTIPNRPRGKALRIAFLVLFLYIILIALLTVVPHAVLLSPMGTLSHSPFSRAIVPIAAVAVILFCSAYGIATRTFTSLTDITDAMVYGLEKAAPLLYCYILIMLFFQTFYYAFLVY